MTDVEEARRLFQGEGLAFPTIPDELAVRLRKLDEWLFSTRDIDVWPYDLDHYVAEVDDTDVADYALICLSGHGVNSYALQYYLVQGGLRMFLHLAWGGIYMDAQKQATEISRCFSRADEVVLAARRAGRLRTGHRLTIVGSHFYGSYWSAPGLRLETERMWSETPARVLAEALHWVGTSPNDEL